MTVAAAGFAAGPAQAAPTANFAVFVNDLTMGGLGGPPRDLVIAVDNVGAVDPTVVVDLDSLFDIVQVGLVGEGPCSFVETGLVCEFPDDPHGRGYSAEARVELRPHEGSIAGESRTVTWRSSAANAEGQEGSATVTVADGVDLVVSGDGDLIEGARPGQETFATIFIGNIGNQPATGLRLVVIGSNMTLSQRDGCEYSQEGSFSRAVCQLDVQIQPPFGEVVDFGFTPTTAALDEDLSFVVTPLGSEPVEINPADNSGAYVVKVVNTADLAVTGATVSGSKGDVVPVTLQVSNLGPATVPDRSGELGAAAFQFVVPRGTTVVGVPGGCFATAHWLETGLKEPLVGAARYTCASGEPTFPASGVLARTFQLQISRVVKDGEGYVQTGSGVGSVVPPYDDQPANNTAKVVVNPRSVG